MTDHKVTVISNGAAPFNYDEEPDRIKSPNHHAHHGDTISWMSPSGDISVAFPHGNPTNGTPPFRASRGQWTAPVRLVGRHGEPAGTSYKYDVTINGVLDDPQIIFDDTGTLGGGVTDLNEIAGSAQATWAALLAELKKTAATPPTHDKDALFFPFGINSIDVNVVVGAVTVHIIVSGPGSGN